MRLKRLELQGFKSFVDRTILSFEAGITGVVGPNGCGKSNIVDAILWVMGEQSAKHLRGESMSDVIFSGSDTRAPTSFAEVTLILDKEGVSLPTAVLGVDRGSEVSITRRLFRDGTSEYLINKASCRLKDICELFMDTGVGRRAYSIIEQGQIDRMVNVRPEDRRMIFEEVAGITKYRSKRKEAERRLELAGQNLARLQDIVGELDKRMRSLKIQATRAKKYKDIKVELETVDLFLLGRRLFKIREAMQDLASERDELAAERAAADARYSKCDAELTELDISRIDHEKEMEQLGARERELTLLIQKQESQLTLFDQQKEHIDQSKATLTSETSEIREELNTLADEKNRFQQERDLLADSITTLDKTIESETESLKIQQSEKVSWEEEKTGLQEKASHFSQREVYFENQKEHGNQDLSEAIKHRGDLNQKLSYVVITVEEKKEAIGSVEEKITTCTERSEKIETEVKDIHSECQALSQNLSELEEQLFEKRETFHAKKSRLQSLIELRDNLEGYSPSAKEILSKLEGTSISAVPLAEVLYPELEVEEHLEILLTESMNTLVVEDAQEAKKLSELIRERDLERVGIFARNEIEKAPTEDWVTPPPSAVALKNKVRCKEGYENIAKWCLDNVYLCQDMDSLFQLREECREATFITGDAKAIAYSDRLVTCGNLPTKTGIFERRREIEELSAESQELEQAVGELSTHREKLLRKLETQEQLYAELKDKLSSIHVESVEYRKEKEKIQLELERADSDYNHLMEDSEKNQALLDEIRRNNDQWSTELAQVLSDKEAVSAQLGKFKQSIEGLEDAIQQASTSLSEKRVERSKVEERLVSLEAQLSRIEGDISHYIGRQQAIESKQSQEAAMLERIAENERTVLADREKNCVDRNEVLVKLSALKDAHNEICTGLSEVRLEKDALAEKREELLAQIQDIELKFAQEKSNFEHEASISVERYQKEAAVLGPDSQLETEQMPLLKSQTKVSWSTLNLTERDSILEEHLVDLKRKTERYGEVNLTAIHEYEEVEKRYEFLMEQKRDLDESVKILEEAIKKIDATTKTRFSETVESVNEKFKEVFPILFGGGKAELTLTDPLNVLESGVDIMAQPPGKRLQSISLLSGGEKALTATSLILAIFARKPSPFCLLDEVDAPLDDANVSRFNTVIQHMSKKSQFIVITHNRRTMEMAHALYGVTMEKSGVSKMTSVRLN